MKPWNVEIVQLGQLLLERSGEYTPASDGDVYFCGEGMVVSMTPASFAYHRDINPRVRIDEEKMTFTFIDYGEEK